MKPFYVWFAAVTLFLVAAVIPLPFALPVPWTGIVLVVFVLSVSALPFAYGRVYIVADTLGVSREPSIDGDDSGAHIRGVGDDGEGTAGRFGLGDEDIFGRESYPLLGSTEARGPPASRSLTWKQCLQVKFNYPSLQQQQTLNAAVRWHPGLFHPLSVELADRSLQTVFPQDVRFWGLFLGFLCSAGSGLVVINNIASLAQSLNMVSSDLLVRYPYRPRYWACCRTMHRHGSTTKRSALQGQTADRSLDFLVFSAERASLTK